MGRVDLRVSSLGLRGISVRRVSQTPALANRVAVGATHLKLVRVREYIERYIQSWQFFIKP
jgi:hypothetical protein